MRTPAREAEVVADVDVCVVGGGPAGLGAALAAARQGATVCLLERHGFLGGNFTAASVGAVCGLYVGTGNGGFDFVSGGIARQVAEQLQAAGRAVGPIPFEGTAVLLYVPWAAKRLFDHLVTAEERITLFLHALVADVIAADGRVEAVVVATKRGPQAVRAKSFVDASGDADLVAFAGGTTTTGDVRQFASMQFFLQHVGNADLAALKPAIAEHGAHLSRDGGALIPTFRPGEYIGAMTRVRAPDGSPLDVTRLDHATYGEIEGRRLAEEAAAFVIEHVPGFEQAFLADTAPNLGVRETRRVRGEYVLTGDDVAGLARFPDAVAAGAWPREYHTEGRSTRYVHLPEGGYYQVPLRALRPAGLANVWVAGRCISADTDALASVRVMGPSMVLGQAAGTAAMLGSRDEGADDVQASLREQGAFLGEEHA